MSSAERHSFLLIDTEESLSFPPNDLFRERSVGAPADVAVIIGSDIARGLASISTTAFAAVLLELRTECLGAHISEDFGREGSNILGFNRFRLGDAPASTLIEMVFQPATTERAKSAAGALFGAAGFTTVFCRDSPGRIVDRLIRPYFNQALTALDEQLADAEQLDRALVLGLGYRRGPVALLAESGLHDHFLVSKSIYAATGDRAYLPARRARTGIQRKRKGVYP